MPYEFLFKGDFGNSYGFETKFGIIYDIQFRPSPYLFGDESKEYSNTYKIGLKSI